MTFISGLCYWRVPRTLVKRALRHDWRGWVNTNVNVPIDDLLCKHSTADYFPFPSLWLQHSWSEHTCFIYVLYIILLWIPTGIKLSLFILTPTFIWELWEHIMASWQKEIWGNQNSKIVVTKSMKIPNILDWRSYFKVKGGPCAVNQHEVEVFHLK